MREGPRSAPQKARAGVLVRQRRLGPFHMLGKAMEAATRAVPHHEVATRIEHLKEL